MLILIVSGHPLLKLVHALSQFSDELIEVSLLTINLVLATTTAFASVRLQVFIFPIAYIRVIDGLSRNVISNIVPFAYEFGNLTGKIVPAKGALCLDLEPLLPALLVEIVLAIALENYYLVTRGESYQANGAIGHVGVFVLVLTMGQVL